MQRMLSTLIIAAAMVVSSWLISNSLVKAAGTISIKMNLDALEPVNISMPEPITVKHELPPMPDALPALPVLFTGNGSATLYTRFFYDDILRVEHKTGSSDPVVRVKHTGPGLLSEPVDIKMQHTSPSQSQGIPVRMTIEQR